MIMKFLFLSFLALASTTAAINADSGILPIAHDVHRHLATVVPDLTVQFGRELAFTIGGDVTGDFSDSNYFVVQWQSNPSAGQVVTCKINNCGSTTLNAASDQYIQMGIITLDTLDTNNIFVSPYTVLQGSVCEALISFKATTSTNFFSWVTSNVAINGGEMTCNVQGCDVFGDEGWGDDGEKDFMAPTDGGGLRKLASNAIVPAIHHRNLATIEPDLTVKFERELAFTIAAYTGSAFVPSDIATQPNDESFVVQWQPNPGANSYVMCRINHCGGYTLNATAGEAISIDAFSLSALDTSLIATTSIYTGVQSAVCKNYLAFKVITSQNFITIVRSYVAINGEMTCVKSYDYNDDRFLKDVEPEDHGYVRRLMKQLI